MLERKKLRWLLVGTTAVTLAAAAAGGCSADKETFGNEDDGAGGTPTTTVTGGMNSASTGPDLPCGVDCTQIATPDCQVAQCNTVTGSCEVVNDENGVSCDDGLFCTISDSCVDGNCVGGPQNDCGMTPPQCTEVTCDEANSTCGTQPAMNGSPCQDPNALCIKGASCTNGLCIGGMQDTCFFEPVPNECHNSECDPSDGICKPVPGNDGMGCTDLNDLCTVNKTCLAGNCQGGSPMDCNYLTMGCDLGICDTTNGMCTTQAVMNGQPCDDLNACTVNETCSNQQCINGTPVTVCEQNGDGCCPTNCNATNDLDCAIQPSCANIKTSVPASVDGVYTIDPDSSGPIQQFDVYCDMTTNLGGWTLIATFANNDAQNWMLDTGEWWYTRTAPVGSTLNPNTVADMYSPAFHSVVGQEFRLSRTDNPTDIGLMVTTGGCLGTQTFRAKVTSYWTFVLNGSWASAQVLGNCPVTFGSNYTTTNGFAQATCSGDIGAPNSVSFWSDWSAGDGAVLMIGGGGNACARADHGIGVTEANAASFTVFAGGEDDFGNNGSDTQNNDNYALTLWVR